MSIGTRTSAGWSIKREIATSPNFGVQTPCPRLKTEGILLMRKPQRKQRKHTNPAQSWVFVRLACPRSDR